jgi:excisionase family DNA binding protein
MAPSAEPKLYRERSVPNTEKRIWVTPNEAIRISGIGRTRLYELMADGTLKSIKLGGKRLISYASIESLGSDPQ